MTKVIYSLSVLLVLLINNCAEKKEKYYYGYTKDEAITVLMNGFISSKYSDTNSGSLIDPDTNLEWKKCSQGQIYQQNGNNCQGKIDSVETSIGGKNIFSAIKLNYCGILGDECNSLSLPKILNQNQTDSGLSQSFASCRDDRTGGYTNWRLPNLYEMRGFVSIGELGIKTHFPELVEENYWTSMANETDPKNYTSYGISFAKDNFGEEKTFTKDSKLFVLCVRNR